LPPSRLKHLLKAILDVDVAEIVRKTIANIAVRRAGEAVRNTEIWEEYMEEEGALIILPRGIIEIGKKRNMAEEELAEEPEEVLPLGSSED
jgi:hypothetical protein